MTITVYKIVMLISTSDRHKMCFDQAKLSAPHRKSNILKSVYFEEAAKKLNVKQTTLEMKAIIFMFNN